MNIVNLADEIYREIDEDPSTSIASITYWLENNIGQLNVLLNETIGFVSTDFDPVLTVEQANIFKMLYLIKFYSGRIKANLGAAAYDWSEISEGDSTIRRVSKNEIAKNYKQVRDSYAEQLNQLVFLYKHNQIKPESYSSVIPPYLAD